MRSKTDCIKDSLLVTGFGYQHGELWEKIWRCLKFLLINAMELEG